MRQRLQAPEQPPAADNVPPVPADNSTEDPNSQQNDETDAGQQPHQPDPPADRHSRIFTTALMFMSTFFSSMFPELPHEV